jgi:hypothetical protein
MFKGGFNACFDHFLYRGIHLSIIRPILRLWAAFMAFAKRDL